MRAGSTGWTKALMAGAVLAVGAGGAAASDVKLYDYAAFGVDRNTGEVVVYSFDESNQASHEPLGQLQRFGEAMIGVQGATHVPGHTGMFYAFWTNDDGQAHLVHVVPSMSDNGVLVSALRRIEGGRVTGAASFVDLDGTPRTFILQRETTIPTYDIDGRIQINPGNAQHMRFSFQRESDSGDTLIDIERGNLTDQNWLDGYATVDGDGRLVVFDDNAGEGGVYDYTSHTTLIQVRPKALEGQGDIEIVDESGEPFELHNSNTYNLTGKLRVKLYNDEVDGEGAPMGHWWLELEGQAQFEQSEVGTLTRIAELRANTFIPQVIEAAVLEEDVLVGVGIDPEYLVGLGARVGANGQVETFVADGHAVYRIQLVHDGTAFDADNPIIDSEPMLLPESRDMISLDFAGEHLGGVDSYASGRFVALDVDGDDTLVHSTNKPGSQTPGAITFVPVDVTEAMIGPANYD